MKNVFLTKDGYINLGDFGCSKALERASIYAKSVVGADLYVSPEVYAKNYNFKSDIWSLGLLLYDLRMLNVWHSSNPEYLEVHFGTKRCRKVDLESQSSPAMIKRLTRFSFIPKSDPIERSNLHAVSMKGNSPSISERYSKELRELIRQMLSRDPKDRPSPKEILEKTFLNDAVNRNKAIPESLKQRFMKATEIFEKSYNEFEDFLSEWKKIIDSLEEIHRKCTIGSLSGSVIGAAGGITALVGAILIPFTFGVSLIVSGVGIGVGIAGGATSAASNIESLEKLLEKYQNVSILILSILEILRLLRRIQKFRHFFALLRFRCLSLPSWWIDRGTFILFYAMCMLGNVSKTGVQTGVQVARVGRAAAVTAEAAAAASGVLSALFLILDVAFIAIDSREIHQMNQGAKDDPEKASSTLLKNIARMNKTHQEMHNLMREVKETREAIINKNKTKL